MPSTVEILQQRVALPFSGKVAQNRFMKAAMSESLATYSLTDPLDRGKPTEGLIRVYEQWGKGEYGIILTGNVMVDKDHLESAGCTIVDRRLPSSYVDEFKAIARVSKAHGSLLVAQLSHPGRQTSDKVQPHPVGPSDIQSPVGNYAKPTPLTKEGIKNVVDGFAYTAGVLHDAGFDGIEAHAAHGYLLAQFLSPKVNNRTDEYGGSLENRSRILFEIIAAVRARVNDPSFIIGVKLNSQDFAAGGFDEDDSVKLSVSLQGAGVDFIEISGGDHETISVAFGPKVSESTQKREAYFVDFAEKLRPHISKSVLAVTGGFRTASKMAEAVTEGWTDVIGLGRPTTFEPLLGKEILSGDKTGAAESRLPLGVGLKVSVQQIAEISKGLAPTDYNDEKNLAELLKA
ncbi:hypothetical protein PLICRDRAFT_177337 [Plicaturopsis crispa FD-325 SS-3]|nr:hypothetical protein PLICRDRAFT_177337 [Plicaturopsis crispa FD-325 SS-3]